MSRNSHKLSHKSQRGDGTAIGTESKLWAVPCSIGHYTTSLYQTTRALPLPLQVGTSQFRQTETDYYVHRRTYSRFTPNSYIWVASHSLTIFI